MSLVKLQKNVVGSRLHREPKLDCGINLNVSSLRLNVAPWWSLGRRMMICTELKRVTAALGDQGGLAVFSAVCLILYEKFFNTWVWIHWSTETSLPTQAEKEADRRRGTKRIASVEGAKYHAICLPCLVMIADFLPCLLELLCSVSNQSWQQRHLLFTAIKIILQSSSDEIHIFFSLSHICIAYILLCPKTHNHSTGGVGLQPQ